MTALRIAAISIDLDEIACYHAIHGLSTPTEESRHAVYDRAVPRFEALFKEAGIHATFFAIGSDLQRGQNAEALKRLHRQGHEIANHSHSHHYDFSRRSSEEIHDEISRGIEAVKGVTGEAPVGFRAPGYTITNRVYRVLEALGVHYDSSVFPCPWYYGAKAAMLGWMRFQRRKSHSILDTPWMLTAPANPYHVGTSYWKRGHSMLELPIGVTRACTGRLPYIGTSLLLAGPGGTRWLTRRIATRPLVNLELHGIDLVDAEEDGVAYLKPLQPDLRKSLKHKLACLTAAIEELKACGYEFQTLAQAARRWFIDKP